MRGRCWVRTNVGACRRFYRGAHYRPSEWPPTCYFSIPGRVKTAICPCGVRSFRVCLVSATHVLDHVPGRLAESGHVPSSCCRRAQCPRPRPDTSLDRRPAAANVRTAQQDRARYCPTLKIRSARPFFTPATDSRPKPRPARQNRPSDHTRLPAFLPTAAELEPRCGSATVRRPPRCSPGCASAPQAAHRLPAEPARPEITNHASDVADPRYTSDAPGIDLA
jgi:hypothetical protein